MFPELPAVHGCNIKVTTPMTQTFQGLHATAHSIGMQNISIESKLVTVC